MTSPSPITTAAALRRVGVATGLMVGSAVGAHVGAGGALPPASVLVFLVSVVGVVGVLVTSGGLRRWASVALVGGSQYAVHEVLVLTAGWSATTACDVTHAHGSLLDDCARAASAPASSGTVAFDARMLTSHLVATVVTGLVLTLGDRAAAAAVTALARVLRRPRPVLRRPVLVPVARRVPRATRVTALSVVCARRRPRRGPPRTLRVTPSLLV